MPTLRRIGTAARAAQIVVDDALDSSTLSPAIQSLLNAMRKWVSLPDGDFSVR